MRIKEVLKEKGLTQQDLADKMGVSLSAVKQMVNADSLTTATLEKMATAIDVPMWHLIVSPDELRNNQQIDTNGVTISCPHCGKPLKITSV